MQYLIEKKLKNNTVQENLKQHTSRELKTTHYQRHDGLD